MLYSISSNSRLRASNKKILQILTKKKPSIYDERLEYWIFDIAIENVVYSERMNILKKLEKEYNKYYPVSKHLHFVYYTQLNCAKTS